MDTQTTRDNQALLQFWDQAFAIPEEAKEAARREGAGTWEELAPSEKLFCAACELRNRKKVLDFGCGNGWAAVAAAKSGCPDVTAADPAPNAADAAAFLAELFGVTEQVHLICGGSEWLKAVPDETFDGILCSNVLDVIPPETAEEILREMTRVVTPDSRRFSTPNPDAALPSGCTPSERTPSASGRARRTSCSKTAAWPSEKRPAKN